MRPFLHTYTYTCMLIPAYFVMSMYRIITTRHAIKNQKLYYHSKRMYAHTHVHMYKHTHAYKCMHLQTKPNTHRYTIGDLFAARDATVVFVVVNVTT